MMSVAKPPMEVPDEIKLPSKAGDVTELRNKYGYILPPIATLQRFYDLEGSRHLAKSIVRSQSTTPHVLRLLLTGRLPVNYFNDLCYGQAKSIPAKKSYHYEPKRERDKNLWEPRPKIIKTEREISRVIFEARFRHREHLWEISQRAHAHQKVVEMTLLRHLLKEPRARLCTMKKLEKEVNRMLEKREKGLSGKETAKEKGQFFQRVKKPPLGIPRSTKSRNVEPIQRETIAVREVKPLPAEKLCANVREISIKDEGKEEESTSQTTCKSGTLESPEIVTPTIDDIGLTEIPPPTPLSPLPEETKPASPENNTPV